MTSFARLARNLVAGLALLAALPALAQGDDDLLPVTQAFHLTSDASQPGMVKLHWRIAPDYYLYRGRIKIKAAEPTAVTLGEATPPDGLKKHDEYLGDVEIYHGDDGGQRAVNTLVDAATKTLALDVQYQGCHEVEPKICYPPNTEHLEAHDRRCIDHPRRRGARRQRRGPAGRPIGDPWWVGAGASRRPGVPLRGAGQGPPTACCCAGPCPRTTTCTATRRRSPCPRPPA